ncbi:MAG TPA: iron ABC transporter permease [Bacteroidales bacterium]|jgi:iron complex transport system permease protein|nr:iron ABC transporter permease [Bacteroidales bacterium]
MIHSSLAKGSSKRQTLIFISLGVLLLLFVLMDLLTGTVKIPVSNFPAILTNSDNINPVWKTIFYDFRIPKTITAILAGCALSVSGLQMQTIFRNPLAGPDVLGVSSGASLGVALVVMGFGDTIIADNMGFLGSWIQIIAAWIGAGIVLFLILIVSLRVRDIMTILILGILFGSAASALVSIMQYFSPQSLLKAFVIWSMGSLSNLTAVQLNVLSISLAVGFILTLISIRIMNVMLLGDNYSQSMGVNIRTARVLVFLSTSLLSGSITAFCGPVAFIGIAVPHLSRLVFRTANHFILIPASILIGSMVMLLADVISQLPGSGLILPVNSVTAILGIPVVIWVIIYNRRFVSLNG